jgi:hypothetical protein
MKPRAHDYHALLVGMLNHLGPDGVAFGLRAFPSHHSIRFSVGTNAAVSTLAESFGLSPPTIERAGTIVWTQSTAQEARLRVIVTGPYAIEPCPAPPHARSWRTG